MKVLYVITRAERGGAQSHLWTLIDALKHSVQPVLVIGEDGFLAEQARQAGITVRLLRNFLHPISVPNDVSAVHGLTRIVQLERPDLIHAHTAKAGLIARIAGLCTGTPVVYTVHAWSFVSCRSRLQRQVSLWLERAVARFGHTVIDVSHFNHSLAEQMSVAKPDKHAMIWNGVPDTSFRASLPSTTDLVRITMVARFAAPKDHLLLLEALSQVTPNWECSFIGSGPEEVQVRERAKSLGIDQRVDFLGDRDDVEELLAQSHIFALSSRSESLPLSILEAMRAGLPVIATHVGGCPELVEDGVTGYLTRSGDAADLAEKIQGLLSSPSRVRAMGQAGRIRFEQHFRIETMVLKTSAVYQRLVPESGFTAALGALQMRLEEKGYKAPSETEVSVH